MDGINPVDNGSLSSLSQLLRRLASLLVQVKAGERHIDDLYHEYARMREHAGVLCLEICGGGQEKTSNPSSSSDPPSPRGNSLDNVPNHRRKMSQQDIVMGWISCLQQIISHQEDWQVDVLNPSKEHFVPENIDNMFIDRSVRHQDNGILAKLCRVFPWMDGQSDILLKAWEARFEHYDRMVRDLADLRSLHVVQERNTWTRVTRQVIQENIAPHGDAMLEFANTDTSGKPVLRFRVSSHMLAECSPLFSRIFSTHHGKLVDHVIPSIDQEADLPPPPTQLFDTDGSRILLWRMPQTELNKDSALTILLRAAHMHNDRVPRTLSFECLVALADVAIRYRCAKPLELFFEHCWLHQWIHKASEDMPDGLVTISYAFGRRRLFSRVTKSVILNIVDEEELRAKNWPSVVKDKIWAVRSAKMSQVYAACSETIEEYLRRPRASPKIPVSPVAEQPKTDNSWSWMPSPQIPPAPPSPPVTEHTRSPVKEKETRGWRISSSIGKKPPVGSALRPISRPIIQTPPPPPPVTPAAPAVPPRTRTESIDSVTNNHPDPPLLELFSFSSVPRCPKGSHWCDAQNLGWLLLAFNELRLFSAILGPSALTGLSLSSQTSTPPRSLAGVLDALRGMAEPPHAVHSGGPGTSGGGVCDPVPAFRDAINDIYNSITGLALQEVDSQRHRAGLSMPRLHEMGRGLQARQMLENGKQHWNAYSAEDIVIGATVTDATSRLTGIRRRSSAGKRSNYPTAGARLFGNEKICLNILSQLKTFDELRAAAMITQGTYRLYKANEKALIENVVRAGRKRAMGTLTADKKKKQEGRGDGPDDSSSTARDKEDRPFSYRVLLSTMVNDPSDDPEGASTRAIKRASSDASSDCGVSDCGSESGNDDEDGEWKFPNVPGNNNKSLKGLARLSAVVGPDSGISTTAAAATPPRTPTRRSKSSSARSTSFPTPVSISPDDDGKQDRPKRQSTSKTKRASTSTSRHVSLPETIPRSFSTTVIPTSTSTFTTTTTTTATAATNPITEKKKKKKKRTASSSSWLDGATETVPATDYYYSDQDLASIPPEYEIFTGSTGVINSHAELDDNNNKSDSCASHHPNPDLNGYYNITEQEAYRILWPADDATTTQPEPPESPVLGSVMMNSNCLGMLSSTDGDLGLSLLDDDDGGGGGRYYVEEEPDLKYSRDEGWLLPRLLLQTKRRSQGLGGGGGGGGGGAAAAGAGGVQQLVEVEEKSLALMGQGNGNNKQLREDFDRRVGLAL